MSDESDAEFERRYPQKRPGMPSWAILLIALGSVGLMGCLGVVGLFAAGMLFGATAAPAGPPPVAGAGPPPQVAALFTRAEFEKLVLGKTPAEVKEEFGEPPVRGGEETWMYHRLTTNPASGQVDAVAEVTFRGGKATRVRYIDAAPPGGPGPQPGGPPPPTGE